MNTDQDFHKAHARVREAVSELCHIADAAVTMGNTALASDLRSIARAVSAGAGGMNEAHGFLITNHFRQAEKSMVNTINTVLAAETVRNRPDTQTRADAKGE